MALFDLTSAWVTGRCCALAARGYSRDGKKGCEQIEYGVLTDPAGRPVAVRVFPGNTADPDAFTEIVTAIRDELGIQQLVLVGDRGMITSARIDALRELNDDPDTATDFGWITALRAPAIANLARDDGPLQMSLFDAQDLAEIAHPDYPGERLIACRNPALAAERTRKRDELLAATEQLLAARRRPSRRRGTLVGRRRDRRRGRQGDRQTQDGQALRHHHHRHQPSPTVATTASIDAEAALRRHLRATHQRRRRHPRPRRGGAKLQEPGQRRTRLPHHQGRRPGPATHPPPPRRPRQSPRADLPARLLPHLAPTQGLGANDIHRRTPTPTRQPRRRPRSAPRRSDAKASRKHDADGNPLRSFHGLLDHLATLTRNQIRYHHTSIEVPVLADPTPDQRRAFDLLDTPIPLTAAA